MYFGLTDDLLALRAGLREVLATSCPPAVIRAAWTGDPCDALWKDLGAFGLPGLLVDQANDGLGLDELALVVALEECGYHGVPGPLVETIISMPLAPLPLDGTARVTVPSDGATPYGGVSTHALDVSGTLYEILPGTAVVTPSVDASRQLATYQADELTIDIEQADAERFGMRASLGTAAFLLGLARRQLELTVAYVKDRHQFGVAIGSYQAIKHPLADAVVGVEFAWPAVLNAASAMVEGSADADLNVSMAKALASDAAYRMSRVCLQAHGAIGYTVEYDLHLFAKRTWAMSKDWGTATEHRTNIAEHLGVRRSE